LDRRDVELVRVHQFVADHVVRVGERSAIGSTMRRRSGSVTPLSLRQARLE